jgi:hypothetical protein
MDSIIARRGSIVAVSRTTVPTRKKCGGVPVGESLRAPLRRLDPGERERLAKVLEPRLG